MTTLAERRIRGDLIEAFKVTGGLTDYGSGMFRISRSGLNLVSSNRCNRSLTKIKNIQKSFLPERVIPYWNKLPPDVKNSVTVLSFKIKLEGFKKAMIPKRYDSIYQRICIKFLMRLHHHHSPENFLIYPEDHVMLRGATFIFTNPEHTKPLHI